MDKEIKIRKLSINDYEALYSLWLSCAGMGINNLDDGRDGIEKFIGRNPDTCLAAETDGAIVGAILAGNDGRRGYIYHTAVAAQYRNKGIASRLVDEVMLAMQKTGINKVGVFVFERNDCGNDFWEHRGFTKRQDLIYRNKQINELIRFDT